ncbi:MAG: FtsQ-type POTRA domain-containing protein [Pseudomonadota bacterium]
MKRTKRGLQVQRAGEKSWSGEKLLKMAGVGLGTICVISVFLFAAYQGLSRAVFFQIEEVNVSGFQRMTAKQILACTGLDVQTNLWLIRTGRIQKQLEDQGWIETVEVRRNWPNKLSIVIRERVAVALVSKKSGLHYVDKNGEIFAAMMPEDDHDFPVITGLEKWEGKKEKKERLDEALQFISLAENGSVTLPKQNISELNVTPEGGLVLFMADNAFPIWLGSGDMKKKYGRLTRVLSWIYRKKQFEQASFIDMNYMADNNAEEKNREQVLVRFADS